MQKCSEKVSLLSEKFKASLNDAPIIIRPYLVPIEFGMKEVFETLSDMAERIDNLEAAKNV